MLTAQEHAQVKRQTQRSRAAWWRRWRAALKPKDEPEQETRRRPYQERAAHIERKEPPR